MSPVTVMEVQRSSGQAGPVPGVGFGAGVRVGLGVSAVGADVALLRFASSFSAITPQEANDTAKAMPLSTSAALRVRNRPTENVILPMTFILWRKPSGTGRAALEDTILT